MLRRAKILALIASASIAAQVAFTSTLALAQTEAAATKSASDRQGLTFEVMPLSLLLNYGKNSAFSGNIEKTLDDNWSVVGGYQHYRFNVSDSKADGRLKDDDDIEFKDMLANRISIGARYYSNNKADSWYAGADLAAGIYHLDWVTQTSGGRTRGRTLDLAAGVGYRWLWDSGFSIRLGGGVMRNLVSTKTTSPRDQDDDNYQKGKDNLSDASEGNHKRAILGYSIDLGLGWTI